MNIKKKFRNKINTKTLYTIIFIITIFIQCCLFHLFAFNHFYLNPFNNPLHFFTWHFVQLSIALFLSSFIYLFIRTSWTLYASVIISIWSIANLIYLRACNLLIDSYAITMAGNMNGFWDSILLYIEFSDLYFLIPNIILFTAYFKLNFESNRSIKNTIILLTASCLLNFCCGIGVTRKYYDMEYFNLFMNPISKKSHNLMSNYLYTSNFSQIHHFIYEFKALLIKPFIKKTYQLSNNEIELANNFTNDIINNTTPKQNLILILVESFENWTISQYITPNLFNFIKNNNRLYCKNVKDNVKGGGSSDGQLIINTGLLPVQEGSTVYEHNNNVFPALSKLYSNAIGIIPGDVSTWNQHIMSPKYGFKNHNVKEDDHDVLKYLNDVINKYDYILTLTISSHQPYSTHHKSSLTFKDKLPTEIEKYLKCINYADECLGDFLESIKHNDSLQNSTIVITGDHKCRISQSNRQEYIDYTKKNTSEFNIDNGYCPLIIFSPSIDKKIDIHQEVLQMDIYPTILDVIDCKDYYWKGFGVSLLDSTNLANRPISEEDAYILSDKLIRANYFKEIEDNLNVYK